ncbi:MAG TPA: tetratricopeptide repeat protein [Terriglobia bacterium]
MFHNRRVKYGYARVSCTTSLAVALVLWSGLLFSRTDAGQRVPHEATKLNQRGLDHLDKKEYDQAIASFREALQVHPEYPEALDDLGKAVDAAGKDSEAIAEFDEAIKIAPENAAAYADKGLALYNQGKYEEAAASYRQAIEHHKHLPLVY